MAAMLRECTALGTMDGCGFNVRTTMIPKHGATGSMQWNVQVSVHLPCWEHNACVPGDKGSYPMADLESFDAATGTCDAAVDHRDER